MSRCNKYDETCACSECDADRAAIGVAKQLWATWAHLGESDAIEQVEAHMESDGFNNADIQMALQAIGHCAPNAYELVCIPAA